MKIEEQMRCNTSNGNYQQNYKYSPYKNSSAGTIEDIFIN